MGYFKARNRNKVRKHKQYLILFLVIIFILLLSIFSMKHKIKEEYLNYLPFLYMGANFTSEEPSEIVGVFEEVNNTKPKATKPIVYIYNTHQTEGYKYNKLQSFNIDYNVKFASYILQSYLEEYSIYSIVEETSMSKTLKENNLIYKQSYKGSRILLENSVKKNPTLKYFIDLHRDSSVYEKTTCQIDNVSYAKVMFLIGLEHDNYEENLELATKLNNKVKAVNPCLSRGIYKKSGPGVDGIYNQDFNKNVMLIELGGQYNTIEEANNTLKILAKILAEYIREDQ